jgi:alpha-galactosidase
MAIIRNDTDKTFTLLTKNTMYQLKIDDIGQLVNTYYGEKMEYMDMEYASRSDWGASFSPNPYEKEDTGYSYNATHQEISVSGVGDFRLTTMGVRNSDGSYGAEPKYVSAKI